jgi:hypothetical protein
MTYKIVEFENTHFVQKDNVHFPRKKGNIDYDMFIANIALNEDTVEWLDETSTDPLPDWVDEEVNAFLFNEKLYAYKEAMCRLAQYQVALGREAITGEIVVGQEFDEDTSEMVDVTESVIISAAIDPVPATVGVEVFDDDDNMSTEEIENPLITQDNEERAAAQAIVDATPQEVIDAYNAE